MKKYIATLLCFTLIIGLALPVGAYSADYENDVNGVIVEAQRVPVGVDVTSPITEEGWGKPTIHVDKNSVNAFLYRYNAEPEDSEMDIYIRWDDSNLYIGVVSPDEDPRGSKDSWTGDGIQFKVSSGLNMVADAKNVYFTLGKDNVKVTAGDSIASYAKNVQIADGKMHAAIAIPFADLGMVKADIKAGAPLSFSILRISGTSEHEYAGWLAWGAFFGVGNNYNKPCTGDNLIVLSNKVAATGSLIEAEKSSVAPVISDVITSNAWGKPSISVDKNSYNAALKNYDGGTAEDVGMDIYAVWDEQYLYLRVVSPETDPRGGKDSWTGDGIQFKISAGNKMSADAKNIYFTLGTDNVSVQIGASDDKCKKYEHSLIVKDGIMYAAIAIPFADLGMTEADVKAGAPLSFSILRISGTSENPYAGWLAWGAFFGVDAENNPGCMSDNVIVLMDKDASDSGNQDEEFESLLLNIPKSANGAMSEAGTSLKFGNGTSHKIVKTKNGIYAVYLTTADIIKAGKKTAVNEFTLQKIANGSSQEVAYGYTYEGLQDIVADADGNVYIVGGGSTWAVKKMSYKYNYKDTAEKAVLNIFKYNEETGTLNGYTAYRPFKNATEGYVYLGSATDVKAGKIYTAYIGVNSDGKYTDIEYFTFDTASMKWEEKSTTFKTELDDMTDAAVFVVDGGMGMVYANASSIRFVKADGTHTNIADGKLCDVYKDEAGDIRVLYTVGEDGAIKLITVKADGTVDEPAQTAISSEAYAVKFVSVGGKNYIVAIDKVNPAEALLYDGTNFNEIARIKMDEAVVYETALMVAGSDIGSVDDKGITIMFAGYRGIAMSWYCATIPVDA